MLGIDFDGFGDGCKIVEFKMFGKVGCDVVG